jgi:hypothetical protein
MNILNKYIQVMTFLKMTVEQHLNSNKINEYTDEIDCDFKCEEVMKAINSLKRGNNPGFRSTYSCIIYRK